MREIAPSAIRVTALFCSAAGEQSAENNCNITNRVVIVVAQEQLDLAPCTCSRENRRPESTHVWGFARALCCPSWRYRAVIAILPARGRNRRVILRCPQPAISASSSQC